VYHSHCIVKWLLRSASCPMCRSKLPTGWFFVQSLGFGSNLLPELWFEFYSLFDLNCLRMNIKVTEVDYLYVTS
jgi:hypothetical protein